MSMSDILIKGMEMPKNCGECLFKHLSPTGESIVCELDLSTVPWESRPFDCPLIEVPKHGRLIDADALRQSIKESIDECHKWADEVEGGEMYARVSQSLGTFVECSLRVKAAPTIIGAEDGE